MSESDCKLVRLDKTSDSSKHSVNQDSKVNPKSSAQRELERIERKLDKEGKCSSSESDDSTSSSSSSSSSSGISGKTAMKKKKLKKKLCKKEKENKILKSKLRYLKEKLKLKNNLLKKLKGKVTEENSIVGPVPLPGSLEVPHCSNRMAPMTKEEWEKKQSVVRRVYDEATGRNRLIKGDGEVLEEIVSKQRHSEINRKATEGDGASFQNELAIALKQKAKYK